MGHMTPSFTTHHHLVIGSSESMEKVKQGSVHLVVTSPPYPMIEMWDETFGDLEPAISTLLKENRGWEAFEAMHQVLDQTWRECRRVLCDGGFLCVNVGDATRSLSGEFAMYPNQARISMALVQMGLTPLPDILWRKPTNAPNKFMGSGMLPAGAYVTYEHEYILVFRKGGKRVFTKEEKLRRASSAFFWEERNKWFSDMWMDLKGVGQTLSSQEGMRSRSGAFPFDLPFRLIQMYSMAMDTVLDPFVGTGTTMCAAAATGRHSLGYEVVEGLLPEIKASMAMAPDIGAATAASRLAAHQEFAEERLRAGKTVKYNNEYYQCPVITRQERELRLMQCHQISISEPFQWQAQVTMTQCMKQRSNENKTPTNTAPPVQQESAPNQLSLLQ